MEKKINNKLKRYNETFKGNLITQIDILNQKLIDNIQNNYCSSSDIDNCINSISQLRNLVINHEECYLDKTDFTKRDRKKNSISLHEQCCAKRANGQQCTRRKKNNEQYCGTHLKGTPNGIINNNIKQDNLPKMKTIEIRQEEISGIIYYIDDHFNVYRPEDILNNIKNPAVIAKWKQSGQQKTIN
tara:strand:- start:100 stop:657 length:558 start_codon:yes stop_codon:yes gene_type:complete